MTCHGRRRGRGVVSGVGGEGGGMMRAAVDDFWQQFISSGSADKLVGVMCFYIFHVFSLFHFRFRSLFLASNLFVYRKN